MNMQQEINRRLSELQPQVFELQDESHLHAGHAGNQGGGHYALLVTSEAFHGLSRLNRQRLIKELLSDLFQGGQIHALSIRAVTPDEYFSN